MFNLIKNKNTLNLYLSHLTWTDYKNIVETRPLIILPMGSVEQHGPHLPLLTDTILSTKLAEKLARKLRGFIAEPFTYGARSDLFSGGGEAFVGTCSLSPETFLALAKNVLDELYLDGLRYFLILNGHFENASLLRESARRITRKSPDAKILFCNWWDVADLKVIRSYYPEDFPGMDLEHAGFLETSLMLYLASDRVKDPSFFPGETIKPPGYEIYPEHLNGLTEKSGALSSAKAANAKAGEEICNLVIEGLIKAVDSVFGQQ